MVNRFFTIIGLAMMCACQPLIETNYVVIGTQEWAAKNLEVETFRNGDTIPHAQTTEEWQVASALMQPAWCYYDNNPANGNVYGKLYNWYAVSDARGLAPEGWHIPSDEEWSTLVNYLGGLLVAGGKLKSVDTILLIGGWAAPNVDATNSTGFTALPSGVRTNISQFNPGGFSGVNISAVWWSSTLNMFSNVWIYGVNHFHGEVARNVLDPTMGLSVRCIKD